MINSKPIRRVLVVTGSEQAYSYIKNLLPPNEFDPVVYVSSANEAKRLLLSAEYDILIVNTPLPDELGVELALNYADGNMGILLLCKSDAYEQIAYKVEESGVLALPRPISKQALFASVKLLCAVQAKIAKMEKKNRTLQEKMADIRVVNRAKWLLIENLGMLEKDAHYYIEKQAMDMRLSRREVAEHIIRTYDK